MDGVYVCSVREHVKIDAVLAGLSRDNECFLSLLHSITHHSYRVTNRNILIARKTENKAPVFGEAACLGCIDLHLNSGHSTSLAVILSC